VNLSALRRTWRSERGFALLESVVSLVLLGMLVSSAMGGLLFGITGAHHSLARATASAWEQAELDYLLLQGYSGLSISARTLTQSIGYTTYGQYSEPQIPAGFDHALVTIQPVDGVSVKQVTVTLYQAPSSPYTIFSTYISKFTGP
jgi:type II secretory pathway pseudopilin PulG